MPDADELLQSIQRLCQGIQRKADANRQHHTTINDEMLDTAECLAENVQRLDEWLRLGKPLPKLWRREDE